MGYRGQPSEYSEYAITGTNKKQFCAGCSGAVGVGGLHVFFFLFHLLTSCLRVWWSAVLRYTLGVLSQLASSAGTDDMSEQQIVTWANEKVGGDNNKPSLTVPYYLFPFISFYLFISLFISFIPFYSVCI